MPDVVAVLGPPSDAWVAEVRRWWDRGAAVAPVDHRLPPAGVDDLLASISPTVVTSPGEPPARLRTGQPAEHGDAIVLATSGTTGAPKGVVITHAAVENAARLTSARAAADPLTDAWLCCLPVAHAGGLGVVTRALLTGTRLIVHAGFDARAVEAAASAQPTLVSLVATTLGRIDPTRFKAIVLGGDAPPARVPVNAMVTYGLTETYGGCVYDGVPLPGVEVRIEGGEILLRSPTAARAYRDGRPIQDADGWLHTGDGGRSDGGRLVVHGRLADVIVTGGEKVWPAAVEAALASHPKVAAVAVVGRPDPEWGHRVVARVVPRDPAAPPTVEELRRHLEHRPAWERPKAVELVPDLPRTALGKIRRGSA